VLQFGSGSDEANLEVGLMAVNAVTNSFISTGNDFSVVDVSTGAQCPYSPVALPDVVPSAGMVQVYVAQSPLDCALWVAYTNKAMNTQLKSNTNLWTTIIPQLNKLFPNTPLLENLYPTAVPSFSFTPQGIALGVSYRLDHIVEFANGTQFAADSIGLDFTIDVNAWIGAGKVTPSSLYANITKCSITLEVFASAIGTIDMTLLQLLIDVVEPIAVKAINAYLNAGFPLPVGTGITLIHPTLQFFNGYVGVAADIVYNPASLLAQYDDQVKADQVAAGKKA